MLRRNGGAGTHSFARTMPMGAETIRESVITNTSIVPGLITGTLFVVVENGSYQLTPGVKVDIPIHFNGIWLSWTIIANEGGNIVFDLWKDTYESLQPTVADTITGSAKPQLVAQPQNRSSILTGWNTVFTAGEVMRVNVDSTSGLTRCTLGLEWRRT